MTGYRLEPGANRWLDEIYAYTAEHWGDAQAGRYINELFDAFGGIAKRRFPWQATPADWGLPTFCRRAGSHVIYGGSARVGSSKSCPSCTSGWIKRPGCPTT